MTIKRHFRVPGDLHRKLEEVGVRVPAVLRRAGLPQDLFAQTRILLTTEELFAFWHAVAELSEDPAVGLKLGTEERTERFHPICLAALAAPDFGTAVGHLARYKRLTCPEEILQSIEEDEWVIRFRWLLSEDPEPPIFTEFCFAWLFTVVRRGSGTLLSPVRLEFMQPRVHTRAIERHFGCPVVCGAPRNAIVFRAQDAQSPFVTRNAELLEMLAPQLELELQQNGQLQDFPAFVRGAVQERLTGRRPAVEDIARHLHMSSRTLQRRLQESGSSFQKVLDEARHRMARHYLSNSVLELAEAAYLLGFEDASSFVRAFRSWEGVPPGHWRQAQRAPALS